MYLSVLRVDVGTNPDLPRPGRLWLRNRYHVHQRLCMAFPSSDRRTRDPQFLERYQTADFGDWSTDKQGRCVHAPRSAADGFLYRVEARPGGSAVILVQSAGLPDWDYAFHNVDYLRAPKPGVREYDPCFAESQSLRFRLQANVTKRTPYPKGDSSASKKRPRIAVPREQVSDWLAKRVPQAGFSFAADTLQVDTGYVYFGKPGHDDSKVEQRGKLFSVRYDGVLRVTDADAFRKAIESGIGPAKAFGFGLLSVAPLRE